MRVNRALVHSTVVVSLLLTFTRDASACSCASPGPPCQNALQVDAVFVGTVQSISPLPEDGPPLRPGEYRIPRTLRVEFVAVVAFRGIQGPAMSVLTAGSGPACGYEFKQGKRYLVYATRTKDGTSLVTGICSRTRRLEDAGEDIRFLQTLTDAGPAGARLSGTIDHWERDLGTGQPRQYGPVADVLITAQRPGNAFEVSTDAQGRYELTLPPGKYDITAVPPAGFSTRYLRQTIELTDVRACAVVNFGMRFDGRIAGVVWSDAGEPVEGAHVEVMAVERVGGAGHIETLREASGAGGAFEFIEVPPGRYVVGVDLTRRMDSKVIYPTTFYPDTPDPKRATVIQIDGGEAHQGLFLTVPPARRSYRLTGAAVFEDGSPASGATVSLQDGTATWRQVAVGIKAESDGTFSFLVHEGLSYVAHASYWDESKRKQLTGSTGPIVVTGDTAPFNLVISSPR